jgi:hypothetical protein
VAGAAALVVVADRTVEVVADRTVEVVEAGDTRAADLEAAVPMPVGPARLREVAADHTRALPAQVEATTIVAAIGGILSTAVLRGMGIAGTSGMSNLGQIRVLNITRLGIIRGRIRLLPQDTRQDT